MYFATKYIPEVEHTEIEVSLKWDDTLDDLNRKLDDMRNYWGTYRILWKVSTFFRIVLKGLHITAVAHIKSFLFQIPTANNEMERYNIKI